MTVVGLDDTDSPEGMCTTWAAAVLAERLRERGAAVERLLLVRLNPAVEHKTRGNAALAVHTDADPDAALRVAESLLEEAAAVDDPGTNPGVVVADHDPAAPPRAAVEWARDAVTDHHDRAAALDLADALGYRRAGWGNARGTVGALAAVGAWAAFGEWTYEEIAYRERERWGTERAVDHEATFAAAEDAYPEAWDTVDRETGDVVCVPNTPCPILHGVRGDDPDAVRVVSSAVGDEPVARRALFLTNQGTDAHLRRAPLGAVVDGRAYRVDGVVADPPTTREGGHVHLRVRDGDDELSAVAFEPTGRFRDHVRALATGDRVTLCGEIADGTMKLEKFAVRSLAAAGTTVPPCPGCGRSMESAGRGQGYRCSDCGTSAACRPQRPHDRNLERGWYEVPPSARRHVAKPLVRGGFDAPGHPER